MLPRAIWGEGVPKPTGNAPRGGSIEGRPNFVWVILGDLDRFKRARVLGFIRPVVPLAGLLLYLVLCSTCRGLIHPGMVQFHTKMPKFKTALSQMAFS